MGDMENLEENVVTKGAAKGDPAPAGVPVEDLGGPTPENYRPDDNSEKLKDPASTLKQVQDVVNSKATKAEEATPEEEVVAEEETTEEEVVSEEETTEEETIAEINVEEDLKALIEGEELSEEFQDKARGKAT